MHPLLLSYWQLSLINALAPREISNSIYILGHFKLCLATPTHNFKWLKMYVICEIKFPTYINVSRLKAQFTINSWLYRC